MAANAETDAKEDSGFLFRHRPTLVVDGGATL
jgi:hypothetical protein